MAGEVERVWEYLHSWQGEVEKVQGYFFSWQGEVERVWGYFHSWHRIRWVEVTKKQKLQQQTVAGYDLQSLATSDPDPVPASPCQ